jgi:hypothetical protein
MVTFPLVSETAIACYFSMLQRARHAAIGNIQEMRKCGETRDNGVDLRRDISSLLSRNRKVYATLIRNDLLIIYTVPCYVYNIVRDHRRFSSQVNRKVRSHRIGHGIHKTFILPKPLENPTGSRSQAVTISF